MELLEIERLELSVIIPCLDEEAAIGYCIDEAYRFMQQYRIQGEVLVVDNGSSDASQAIAVAHGARVVLEKKKGYGNALKTGIAQSCGGIIIMGDGDATYDFLHLEKMYDMLKNNSCDMVIGNRYAGGMEQGSMPLSHKLGVRFLSFCGRIRFHTDVYDFHCGLRGMTRDAAKKLELHTDGMEFATEMIASAVRQKLCIGQVPVKLRKCNYDRSSKLRTIQDGIRHLKYIFLTGGE